MINWIILCVALVVVCVVAFVLECREFYGWTLAVGVVSAIGAGVILMCCPIMRISFNSKCSVFAQQKAYIESHVAENAVEDVALTAKKVELNDWLFAAQYSKARYGSWSLYPDAVMDLEPIE